MARPRHGVRITPAMLGDTLWLVVSLVVAAAPLWWVYLHPVVIVTVVGGAFTGALLAIIGARLGVRAGGMLLVVVLLYPLAGLLFAVPAVSAVWAGAAPPMTEFLRALGDVLIGAITSWKEVLTAVPPLGQYDQLLLPPLIVLLGCAVVGTTIILRTSHQTLGHLLPFVVLVFGAAFGTGTVGGAPAALAGGSLLVLWALRSAVGRGAARIGAGAGAGASAGAGSGGEPAAGFGARRSTTARLAAACTVVVVCGGIGFVSSAAASPSIHRGVLRDAFVPPLDLQDQTSPLTGYRASLSSPRSEETVLTVDGLPDGARIRLAALDDYTGLVFRLADSDGSAGSGFQRVPAEISRPSAAGGHHADVTVLMQPTTEIWMPTVGDLERLTIATPNRGGLGDHFVYDRSRSVGALIGGFQEATSYRVEAVTSAEPDLDEVAHLRPGTARQPDAAALPEDLIAKAAALGEPSASHGEQLAAVLSWLRSGYVSHGGAGEPFSRPGHSIDRLNLLVNAEPMLGDAEQYASALAIVAKEIGFPSRVVVGYLPDDGRRVVRGADLTAWAEVQDDTGRWVVLDPNPEPRPIPQIDQSVEDPAAHPRTVLPPEPPDRTEHVDEQQDENEPEDDTEQPAWITVALAVLRIVGPFLLGVLLLLSPALLTIATTLVRRRRRRQRDRRRCELTGLWDEARDGLVVRGLTVHRAATRAEAAEMSGVGAVRRLADDVDRSVFARDAVLSEREVALAWGRRGALFEEFDAGRTRLQRLRTRCSPLAIIWWARDAAAVTPRPKQARADELAGDEHTGGDT